MVIYATTAGGILVGSLSLRRIRPWCCFSSFLNDRLLYHLCKEKLPGRVEPFNIKTHKTVERFLLGSGLLS